MDNWQNFSTHLKKLNNRGETQAVRLRVEQTKGSVPREAGTSMLITASTLHGTIGGGQLEHKAICMARQQLTQQLENGTFRNHRFPLAASLGQCCGGVVELRFEMLALKPLIQTGQSVHKSIYPSRFEVVVFGAGHVGRALITVLGTLPCDVTWIDSRKDIFPAHTPDNVKLIYSEEPRFELGAMSAGLHYIVMTHSHQLDEQIVEGILNKGDSAFCGLIGSRSKQVKFKKRLKARGMSEYALSQLTCPIGDLTQSGKHPGEIAVTLAQQLIKIDQMQHAEHEQRSSNTLSGTGRG